MVFYKILAVHECLLKAKNWGEMGQKRCARSGLHHIWLILMKSVQNEKSTVSSNDYGVPKKFPPFKRKKYFLAVFVILEKSQKWPKVDFFFWKVEIFSAHLNHLRKLYFLIFYTFWFVKKMGENENKNTFVHGHFLPFLAKKLQKYQFLWKIPFLRFVLRVILDQLAR